MNTRDLLLAFPARYIPGRITSPLTFYFSIGDDRYTLRLTPTDCQLTPGKTEGADCVVKADPVVFENLVLRDRMPGAFDIARGKFKTNDPALLMKLKECFRPA